MDAAVRGVQGLTTQSLVNFSVLLTAALAAWNAWTNLKTKDSIGASEKTLTNQMLEMEKRLSERFEKKFTDRELTEQRLETIENSIEKLEKSDGKLHEQFEKQKDWIERKLQEFAATYGQQKSSPGRRSA